MKIKKIICAISFFIFVNITLQAQLGISHLNHKHTTLLSLNYEPFGGYVPFLIRYGRVYGSNTFVAANIGFSESPFNGSISPNVTLPEHFYTAGVETEYYLTRSVETYPLSISTFVRYQYELFDQNIGNDSEHKLDVKLRAYYTLKYKKVSISPYISYGFSNWSDMQFAFNHDIGGIIGLHFSESDYCYLSVYSQRFGRFDSADQRTFVSLGLLW